MALITLTSDIGPKDFLVGALKGQLLKTNPDAALFDITHALPPFNFPQAAYVCRNALRHFPAFSFHIVLVNLFDKKSDYLLLAYHQEQYILCADNGLLTMILEEKPELVIGLPVNELSPANTLTYAGVMGKAIQQLQSGMSLKDIGIPDIPIVEKNPIQPYFSDNWIEGHIIFIDHFENIVLNITREQFDTQRRGRSFRIVFKRDRIIDKISQHYSDVPEGESLALFNSAGYLEIAINKGNAAGLFGLQGFLEMSQNQQNRLFYQTARIFFE